MVESESRWSQGARYALALGPIAAAAELALSLLGGTSGASISDRAVLLLVASAVNAVAAALFAFLFGFVHRSRAGSPAWQGLSLQLGLASGALAAAHLIPLAVAHDAIGESTVAIAALAQIPIIAALATFAVRILLSRPGAPWQRFLSVGAIAAGVAMAASTPPALPPAGPSTAGVLLVTLDGFGARDGVGLDLPTLTALAPHAFQFTTAVAPSSSLVANAATVTSGVHPLQHQALTDNHAMRPGIRGLAAPFATLGLPAVGVMGDVRLDHEARLDGGFVRWIDDLGAPLVGLGRMNLTRRVGLPLLPTPPRASDEAVVDAALANRASLDAGGLLWVHLAGAPWTAPERSAPPEAWITARNAARDAREATDTALGHLLTELGVMGGHRSALIVGLRGVSLGQHGVGPEDPSLWDEALVVPIYATGPAFPPTGASPDQVTLLDIAPTVYKLIDEVPPHFDGVDLPGQLNPAVERPAWTPLASQTLDGTPLVGLRTDDVKALLDVNSEALSLYDLAKDPAEQHDIFAEQPELARMVAGLLRDVSKRVEAVAPTR